MPIFSRLQPVMVANARHGSRQYGIFSRERRRSQFVKRGPDSSARLVSAPISGIGSHRGTVREAGLYFVAYTKALDIVDLMLARMMGTTDDGNHDRLMEFSRAVTGATFFVPSLETIASLKP